MTARKYPEPRQVLGLTVAEWKRQLTMIATIVLACMVMTIAAGLVNMAYIITVPAGMMGVLGVIAYGALLIYHVRTGRVHPSAIVATLLSPLSAAVGAGFGLLVLGLF